MNKPFNDLSSTLKNLDQDISKISNSSGETKNKLADVTSSFSMWNGTVKALRDSFDLMEASLSAGLSIIITFGPEILKWIILLTKGKEAITQAKLSLDTLNKAFQNSDYSNAIKQMNELKINVGLAKKVSWIKKKYWSNTTAPLAKPWAKQPILIRWKPYW